MDDFCQKSGDITFGCQMTAIDALLQHQRIQGSKI
jgi:hypothetical protein